MYIHTYIIVYCTGSHGEYSATEIYNERLMLMLIPGCVDEADIVLVDDTDDADAVLVDGTEDAVLVDDAVGLGCAWSSWLSDLAFLAATKWVEHGI